MEYNLSMLFDENEFDVQKVYHRYGTKEAYFAVLHRFTIDSKTLLEKFQSHGAGIDIKLLTRSAERLQGILSNIGAIGLAWKIQGLSHYIDRKYYVEYSKELGKILPMVERLRNSIISAEKAEGSSKNILGSLKEGDENETPDGKKRRAKLRYGDFEKLLMLIDNFEFESARKTASLIMKNSYTCDIDEALENVCKALEEFNSTESLEEAQRLLGLVGAQEAGKPVKKNILAIDDVPDVLRTVKAMLKDKYNVYGMTNYDSAIKFLRSNAADLILLDIQMPGLDGFAMMQLFRKLPEYARTPIIFLTGNASDEHVKTALSLGASDFIKKPVDLDVLVSKLENAMSRA